MLVQLTNLLLTLIEILRGRSIAKLSNNDLTDVPAAPMESKVVAVKREVQLVASLGEGLMGPEPFHNRLRTVGGERLWRFKSVLSGDDQVWHPRTNSIDRIVVETGFGEAVSGM